MASFTPLKTAKWKNGTNCCSWLGVTCDDVSGRVIGLNLAGEGLQGKIHPNSTLFHLAHLQSLNLSYNDFSGTHFHSKFGGFQSLTHLDLSYCYFQGEIPPQISHLSKLTSLHLSMNRELAWNEITLKRLVRNATLLRELIIDYTNMSSIRPNLMNLIFNQSSSLVNLNLQATELRENQKMSILCLPSIQKLDMSENYYLEVQLPELSCSTSLRTLDLSSCQFHGPIPLSFSNFTHLNFLSLSWNRLNGSIPSSLLTLPRLTFLYLIQNKFSGQIPNVFHQSNKFQELDLSDNRIRGVLPTSLSYLQQLTRLILSLNLFSGQIPDVFDGMTKLLELRLSFNRLERQIPSSLFNLNQLVTLDCSYNNLEGPLPSKITGLQKLTYLALCYNLLNGTIPSYYLSLPSLEYLDLSNNQLTGHISAISSYSIKELHLCGNKLQGNLSESIFNLANLTTLCLSSNNLSGLVNFKHLSNLQNLQVLSLSHNNQLSLNFESHVNYNLSQLSKLDMSSVNLTEFPKLQGKFPSLHTLDLSNNKLKGRVPNWLLETLGFLNLSQNLFSSMDKISKNIDQLSGLDLSFNLLDSDLSESICNMSSLGFLNLAHNKLTGIIPQCLSNLSSLSILDLQMNKFHGTLPSKFSKGNGLITLNLNGNQIDGDLPKSLSNCIQLQVLNLGSNKIEGHFPDWLQTLQDLKVLVLRNNKLHGLIANIKINRPFPSLIILDISGNSFSGPLPKAYLRNCEAMRNAIPVGEDYSMQYRDVVILSNKFQYMQMIFGSEGWYYDSVALETKGIESTLVKIPNIFVSIDFSRNKFEGDISNVFGELYALIGLNLSYNRLTGPIPHSIGNLTNLEWLDLSSNMFTGMIPKELTNLNSLEVLNLSHNHLMGEIPQGKQFNTFSNDSYEENKGLCGFPLSMKCGPQQHSPPSPNNFCSEEKFGFGWKPVAIGYGCGMVIGIGLGYFVFLIGKPRWLVMIFGGQPKRRVKRRT